MAVDLLSIALTAAALHALPPRPAPGADFDSVGKPELNDIESQYLKDQMLAAMAYPYKYRVTQMPCKAQQLQPQRGWRPAREPSGNIRWIAGKVTRARWSGIYASCFIESPVDKDKLDEALRTALECECNGWLPQR